MITVIQRVSLLCCTLFNTQKVPKKEWLSGESGLKLKKAQCVWKLSKALNTKLKCQRYNICIYLQILVPLFSSCSLFFDLGLKFNASIFFLLGRVRSLSTSLWSLTHLTALHLNDNYLSRIPPDIAKLHNLVYLDLSSNKLRSLPAELGNMVSLR